MTDEKKVALATKVYKTLCDSIDSMNWHYSKDEDELVVHFGVEGDDIPMKFIFAIDVERQLVRLMSPMQFNMSEDKRMDGAIATCVASNCLIDGSFDYDINNGAIFFRMTTSFRESEIGEGLFQYMIAYACQAVDTYNDKFLAIEKGALSIADFISSES